MKLRGSCLLALALGALSGFGCSSKSSDRPQFIDPTVEDSSLRPDTYRPDTGVDLGTFDASLPDTTTLDTSSGDSSAEVALPATCSNGLKDGTETDVDCGGSCAPCKDGKACVKVGDCTSGVCKSSVCQAPTCTDLTKNGDETDTDCGGPSCPRCGDGKKCDNNDHCTSFVCGSDKVCKAPSCTDGVRNGTESDVDCGTDCPRKCDVGKKCGAASDCTSAVCTDKECKCPPGMIVMPTSALGGGSYCVDDSEVTYAQYVKFWTASPLLSGQPSYCSWNTTWTPSDKWPPLAGALSGPVRHVDWCDAYAYCKWAGKRLCGKIGGGPNDPIDFKDHLKSQWYNACSSQGVNVYPYGNTYNPTACNGKDRSGALEVGVPGTIPHDPGSAFCQGGAPNLWHMSGNVAEWEDSCAGPGVPGDAGVDAPSSGPDAAPPGADDFCQLRGGSFEGDSLDLACGVNKAVARKTSAADIGFRCCL